MDKWNLQTEMRIDESLDLLCNNFYKIVKTAPKIDSWEIENELNCFKLNFDDKSIVFLVDEISILMRTNII